MYTVRMVAVFHENKVGEMTRTTKILADAGINIRCVSVATSNKFGVVRFLVNKTEEAFNAIKTHGLTVSLVEVLAAEVEDRPGGLFAIVNVLAEAGINVENASGFVIESNKLAVLILEVSDIGAAKNLLLQKKIHLLTEDELLNL